MSYGFQQIKYDDQLKMGQAMQGQAISAQSNMNRMKEKKDDAPHTTGGAVSALAGGAVAGASLGSAVASGTSLGSSAGPWGAAIGAAAGLLSYYLS
ncbi:MAG: hypothetical protein RBT11_14210 [Desulfobacterales bacterium]|jgi:hypothetical protein|nr:hypothetical protein [Desulfobacterales bacterium]